MKKTRLNVLCGMGLALCLSSQAAAEPSVLFRVGFDAYTVRADEAGGAAESPDLSEGLMLRMHDGRGKKGNAVYLNGGERIRYQGRGNICPQRGTISFWVAPMGWKASVKGPRPFVTFEMPRFRLTVGKISAPTGFGIECAWDDAPTVSKREMANALLTDAEWEDGRWHRFDAVWSEKGLKFFVDGVARRASDIHGYLRTCSDVAFARRWKDLPQEAPEGSTITVGGMRKGESTAFDEIEIRDYPMTEAEARAEYVKYYELAQGVPPVQPPRPPRTFDETPYTAKVGVDHTVPEPWTPIAQGADGAMDVLLRRYRFDEGPFPAGIAVEGEDVLASAPKLSLETASGAKAPVWRDAHVVSAGPDVVVREGRGAANGLNLSWKGEIWFDGAYILELSAEPAQGAETISSMSFGWTVPADFSKYLLTNRIGPNGDVSVRWTNSYDRAFVTHPYRAETLLWLTGFRKGFLWWADSDANCVHRPGSLPVHLRRTANGDCDVRIEYVNTPAKLTRKATWRLVFQATPTRTPPKDYRRFYNGDNSLTPHQNAFVFSWSTWHDWLSPQDQTHCASHWPRDFEAYGQELRRLHAHNNLRLMPYNMPGVLGDNEPEWDTKLEEWQRVPSRWAEGGKKGGEHWKTRQCCGNTGIADRDAWRFEKVMSRFAKDGQAGVYYDLCDPEACENELHGCGGTDAFGRAYKSNIALHLREYLMRIYKIAHRHGGMVFNHAHNYFNPVCHGFSDYWFPGEQHHGGVARNPERFYTDDLTPYELECAWNPEIKGVGISQLGRHDGAKLTKHGLAAPEYAVRAMAPFVVHDVMPSHGKLDGMTVDRWWGVCEDVNLSAAAFRGYWQPGPVLSSNPKVMASVYTWERPSPYRAMLVACNYDSKAASGLRLPPDIPDDARFRDLWNGKDLTRAEFLAFEIPAGEFAAIGIAH